MSGKGSAPRPFSVSNEEYAARWDEIFGKKEPECDHPVWTYEYAEGRYKCVDCGERASSPSEGMKR